MTKLLGIYKIYNLVTKLIYIGSAQDIKNRWNTHRSELNRRVHGNTYLQAAWNKYGSESFIFEIVEQCERDRLVIREQYWMDLTQRYKRAKCYNLKPTANSPIGYKLSEEHKANIGKAHLGRKRPVETGRKISAAKKGKPKLYLRKYDKWPHELGNKCACEECKQKWRITRRGYDANRRPHKNSVAAYIMLEGVSL